MRPEQPSLFGVPTVVDATVPPETVAAKIEGLAPSLAPFRRRYLAGMIAAWRYGDAPTVEQRRAADELADVVDRMIRDLP